KYVRRDHVGQRDDMRAVVDPGHQRRRQRVAAVREHDMTALRALGLHNRGEPRESSAPLTVRHRDVAHQIDVVGQDESDLDRVGGRLLCLRTGWPQRDQTKLEQIAADKHSRYPEGRSAALACCNSARLCCGMRYVRHDLLLWT